MFSLLSTLILLAVPPTPVSPTEVPSGTLVSVRVVDGFSPYHTVTYEVLWRKQIAVANHYRGLVGYNEPFHDMALVTREEFHVLLADIKRLGGLTLPSISSTRNVLAPLTWEVELCIDGVSHSFRVDAPEVQGDPRYFQVIDAVRTFVVNHTNELVFRNIFFEPGTYGWVNLTSVPPAKVFIDGRDIGMKTPIYGYELPVGAHALRLVAVEQGWERKHNVRITPGMTTIIHFDLR